MFVRPHLPNQTTGVTEVHYPDYLKLTNICTVHPQLPFIRGYKLYLDLLNESLICLQSIELMSLALMV